MMKTLFTLTACFLLLSFGASAQMKIGAETAPNANSVLELESSNQGFVLPRVVLVNVASISPFVSSPLVSTMVYSTAAPLGGGGVGVYYWDGTKWNFIANSSAITANSWLLTGNTGTVASTSAIGVAVNNNFIGTTDTKDFVFATNNLERMRMLSGGQVTINALTSVSASDLFTVKSSVTYPNAISGYATTGGIGVLGLGNNATLPSTYAGAGGSFYSTATSPTVAVGAYGSYNPVVYGAGLFGKGNGGSISLPASTDVGVLGIVGNSTATQVGVAGISGTVPNSLPTSGVYGSSSVGTNPGVYANNTNSGGLGLTVIGTTKLGIGTYTWPSVLPTAGQVLSSTVAGVLSWATPATGTLTAANNGLSLIGTTVQLGGPLIQATTITQAAFNMIYNLTGTGDFQVQKNGTDIMHVYSTNSNVGLANGTVTNPAYTFINNTDMGIYRNTTNDMRFVTNGVDRMRISKAASNATAEVWVNLASPYLGDVFSATSNLDGDYGVNGYNTAAVTSSGGSAGGVYGEARSLNAPGVWGVSNIAGSTSSGGTGVIGTSNALTSSVLTAGSGGAFTGLTTGVYAVNTSNAAGGQSIYTTNGNGASLVTCRINYWSGTTQYKILGTGTVSTVAKGVNNDKVTLHAPEAPEIYFEDYGQNKLINGKAHIELDQLMSKNVTINQKHPLRVFIQLEGDCKGVYVTNKTTTGFDVAELNSGTSNTNFQWHIVCNRADEDFGNGRISKNADARFEKAPDDLPEKSYNISKKN